MRVTIDVEETSGNMAINVDREGVPPPMLHWVLLKAAAAVFNPPPPPKIVAAPAEALRQINGAQPPRP